MHEEEASCKRIKEENDEKLIHKISQSIMHGENELRRDDLNILIVNEGGKAQF